jgi:hypothetical protein
VRSSAGASGSSINGSALIGGTLAWSPHKIAK